MFATGLVFRPSSSVDESHILGPFNNQNVVQHDDFVPPPKVPSCAEDWESKRALITQLYVHQNRHLDDVRTILELDHGFKATLRMFKARTKAWNLRKNVKASEMMSILNVKATRDAVGKPSSFRVHDRPVMSYNIARFRRRRGLNMVPSRPESNASDAVAVPTHVVCLTPELPYSVLLPRSETVEARRDVERTDSDPHISNQDMGQDPYPGPQHSTSSRYTARGPSFKHHSSVGVHHSQELSIRYRRPVSPLYRCVSTPAVYRSSERILKCVQNFYQSRLESILLQNAVCPGKLNLFSKSATEFACKIDDAAALFRLRRTNEAFNELRSALIFVEKPLRAQGHNILGYIFDADYRELDIDGAGMMLRQLYDLSVLFHGPNHPITLIFLHLFHTQYRETISFKAMEIMELVSRKCLGPSHVQTIEFGLRKCCMMFDNEQYVELERLLRNLSSICASSLVVGHTLSRKIHCYLAWTLYHHYKDVEAEDIVAKLLQQRQRDDVHGDCLFLSSVLLEEKGDILEAEWRFREALMFSIKHNGLSDAFTLQAGYDMHHFLVRQGRTEEAQEPVSVLIERVAQDLDQTESSSE